MNSLSSQTCVLAMMTPVAVSFDPVRIGMCYDIENVKEQHQGEAERLSVKR